MPRTITASPPAEESAVLLKFYSDNVNDKLPVTLRFTLPGQTPPGFGWGMRPNFMSGDDFSNVRWGFERVELYNQGILIFVLQTCISDGGGKNYLRLNPGQHTFEVNCQIPCLIAGDDTLIPLQWTFTLVGSDIHVDWAQPWNQHPGGFLGLGHKKSNTVSFESLDEFATQLSHGVPLQLAKPSAGKFLDWLGKSWPASMAWSGSKDRPTQASFSQGTRNRDIQAKVISLFPPAHLVNGQNIPNVSTPVFGLVDQGYMFSTLRDVRSNYFLQVAGLPATQHFWFYQLHQRPSDQWLALHFNAGVPAEGAGPITVGALGDASEAWNQMVEQYKRSLSQADSASHICLLPTIDSSPKLESWITFWNTSLDLSSKSPVAQFKLRSIEPYLYNLYTLDPDQNVSGGSNYIHTLNFNFASNNTSQATPARENFRFRPIEPGVNVPPDDNVFKFCIGLPDLPPEILSSFYRLGSLDLQFGGKLPHDIQQQTMYFAVTTLNEVAATSDPAQARFQSHFYLPVLRLWPGNPSTLPPNEFLNEDFLAAKTAGTDITSIQHGTAITIDIDPQPPNDSINYWAEINESNPVGQDRSLSIDIRAKVVGEQGLGPGKRILVLDSNPFLVAVVSFEGFDRVDPAQDVLASFNISPDQKRGKWFLASRSRDLYLPPAVLGEEMVRANELAGKEVSPQPFDFRFGSATHVVGLNTVATQTSAPPPWALESILGFEGDVISGAAITSLQFELLYGLMCKTPDSGVAGAPRLRLAEMFATLGSIAGPYKATTQSPGAIAHWNSFAALYNKRFAVLAPDIDGAIAAYSATDQLHVVTLDGLSCTLRSEAEEYYQAKPSANADNYTENVLGLKGGVTWGFEQPRILNQIISGQAAAPGVGQVVNPYFSAIGGTGFQRVAFDQGVDRIVSNTEQGRTSFFSISRLGRIAVFGNRSRHVVEYERTTLPGHQFEGSQPKFAGRPVLRKVREFIEILETKLALDKNTNALNDCSFINSIEFKTTKIPVDAAWGSNVGDPTNVAAEQGWKIPLWRRAPRPPVGTKEYFYEKPEVVMNLAGAESVNEHTPDIEAVHENPERLFFYTRTSDFTASITGDPATWPLIAALDYSEAPVPAPCAGAFKGTSVHEAPATEPRIPIGHSAFTYRLSPGHGDVNVVGGRQPNSTFSAVLKNVTIFRTTGKAAVGFAASLASASTTIRQDVFGETRALDAKASASAAKVQANVNELQTKLNNLPNLTANFIWTNEKALIDRWCKLAEALSNPVVQTMDAYSHSVPPNRTKQEIVDFLQGHLDEGFSQITALPSRVLTSIAIVTKLATAFTHAQGQLAAWQKQLNDASSKGDASFDAAIAEVREAVVQFPDDVRAAVEGAIDSWVPCAGVLVHAWDPLLESMAQQAATILDQHFDNPAEHAVAFKAEVDAAVTSLNGLLDCDAAAGTVNLCTTLQKLRAHLKVADVDQYLHTLIEAQHARVSALLQSTVHAVLDPVNINDHQALQAAVVQLVAPIKTQINSAADSICTTLHNVGQQAATEVYNLIQALVGQASQEVTGLLNKLAAPLAADLAAGLESIRNQAEEALGRFADNVLASLPANYSSVPAGQFLSLARALGTPPRMPNLGFNVPQMAYFYPLTGKVVNLTPIVSKVQDLGAALAPLSSGLPTLQLNNAIQMPDLQNFKIGDLFPDFAGLKLSDLFPDVSLPPGAKDHINITRKFDAPSRTASVGVHIDKLPLTGGTLFSVGPVTLKIDSVLFNANVDIVGNAGGVKKSATGTIVGNWKLNLGDMDVVTFNNSELSFDESGHIHFSLNPQNMVLNQALGMIQSALSSFVSDPNSGFSIVPSPTAILARYVLAVPNIGSLTTGITNLTFGFQLGLEFAPFAITTGLSLGQEDAPFNIAIYILGGGGYVGAAARYQPGSVITCSFAAELAASASFSISLGPLHGFVGIYLGMSVRYASGSSGSLRIGIFIMVVGQASLLGIVSVYLQLRLDAFYDKGSFTGRASVQYRIKICWCFTLHVSASVHMTIGHGGTETAALRAPSLLPSLDPVSDVLDEAVPVLTLQDYITAANQYLSMLNED